MKDYLTKKQTTGAEIKEVLTECPKIQILISSHSANSCLPSTMLVMPIKNQNKQHQREANTKQIGKDDRLPGRN